MLKITYAYLFALSASRYSYLYFPLLPDSEFLHRYHLISVDSGPYVGGTQILIEYIH